MRGFDIGYVLFIDIVAYSGYRAKSKKVVRQLNETVRATPVPARGCGGQLCVCPQATAWRWYFPRAPKRRCNARWRLAAR